MIKPPPVTRANLTEIPRKRRCNTPSRISFFFFFSSLPHKALPKNPSRIANKFFLFIFFVVGSEDLRGLLLLGGDLRGLHGGSGADGGLGGDGEHFKKGCFWKGYVSRVWVQEWPAAAIRRLFRCSSFLSCRSVPGQRFKKRIESRFRCFGCCFSFSIFPSLATRHKSLRYQQSRNNRTRSNFIVRAKTTENLLQLLCVPSAREKNTQIANRTPRGSSRRSMQPPRTIDSIEFTTL